MRVFGLLAFAGCAALLAGAGGQQEAGVPSIITREKFDAMLSNRSKGSCEGGAFYTYDAFVKATSNFPAFAAFFGQTSHETVGMMRDDAYAFTTPSDLFQLSLS